MDWRLVWLFASPLVAVAGMVWGTFAIIHADEAKSRKKKTTDA